MENTMNESTILCRSKEYEFATVRTDWAEMGSAGINAVLDLVYTVPVLAP